MRIGVFDSGVGGITVLTELRRQLRDSSFVYLGDTANVPYGPKSAQHVERLSVDCALRLKKEGVDAVVVACNTASALALPAIQKAVGKIPVHGVVEPGVQSVANAIALLGSKAAPVLVLATRATIRSRAYGTRLEALLGPQGHPIIEQACPLLVPMIEEGWIDHPILHQTIAEYVGQHVSEHAPGVALLGCTHYPWIRAAFERALPGWEVVDSAQAVAEALGREQFEGAGLRAGRVEWIFTDPHAVPAFARALMEQSVMEPV